MGNNLTARNFVNFKFVSDCGRPPLDHSALENKLILKFLMYPRQLFEQAFINLNPSDYIIIL